MLDTYLDPVQQQTEAHTADVTPRASQVFGRGAPVPRRARIVLGAITAAWYVGTMIGLSQVLVLAQKYVSF